MSIVAGCLPDGRTMHPGNRAEWPDQPPAAVLSRDLVVADVGARGVRCMTCGHRGTDGDTETYLAYLAREVEPDRWVCLACTWCDDCDRAGHEAGTALCPWEVGG